MILEGLVSTVDEVATVHLSTMGALVFENFGRIVLRPFQGSRTYANLKRSAQGVFHVTDDVELLAHAAIGQLNRQLNWTPVPLVDGFSLDEACRWYAFRVTSIDDSQPRAVVSCMVVSSKRQRDFFGLNRAKHAVVEAAIMATRLSLIPRDQVHLEMSRLAPLVEKTGGVAERRVFAFLDQYIRNHMDALD